MKSSTSVIKSDIQSRTSSWAPSELDTLAPLHTDPMLDETAVYTNLIPLPPVQSGTKNAPGSNLYTAREQAETILADARKQAEIILKEAYEQGYREGRANVEQDLIEASAAAQKLVEETTKWQTEFLSSAEPQILSMVIQIAEKLFGKGFQLEEEVLQSVLTQVLQRAKSLGELRCFLHPGDIAVLNKQWADKQQVFFGIGINFVPDESIQRGGCLIEGLYGSVDARLETRLESLMEALKQAASAEQGDSQ
ncbi:MAG: hypothetical protein JXA25_18265 [Anaerolineales bacterium]|nr:hypothetical protein [Anaerolineales bacterium]